MTTSPGPRTGIFASLRTRNYRLYASGQVVSLVGTWMQRVAQDWLVLELSGGSALALGIAVALQFGPTLALSLPAGLLADRYEKRRLLVGIQCGLGSCALVLGLLDLTGTATLAAVYALCVALGCFAAIDAPVRQSFAGEMVGPAHLTNAVALNSMTFNVARIVGPAVAGLLIASVGTAWVFLGNAVSFVAVVAGLVAMRPGDMWAHDRAPRAPRAIREALALVRARPDLLAVLGVLAFASTFGIAFYSTLAVLVRNVYGLGADAYGLLSAVLAVGCLAGSFVAARRVGRPRVRTVLLAAAAFGVAEFATGLMPTFALTALLLVPTGLAQLVFTTAANAAVQLGVDESVRGRVMGLYMLVLLGGAAVGGPVLGWLAELFGGRAPMLVGGAVTVLAAVVAAVVVARSRPDRQSPCGGSAVARAPGPRRSPE